MQNKPGQPSAKQAGDLFFLLVMARLVGTLAYGFVGTFMRQPSGPVVDCQSLRRHRIFDGSRRAEQITQIISCRFMDFFAAVL